MLTTEVSLSQITQLFSRYFQQRVACRLSTCQTVVRNHARPSSHKSAAKSVPETVTPSLSRCKQCASLLTKHSAPNNRCLGNRLSHAVPSTRPRCSAEAVMVSTLTYQSFQARSPHGLSMFPTSRKRHLCSKKVINLSAVFAATTRMDGVSGLVLTINLLCRSVRVGR